MTKIEYINASQAHKRLIRAGFDMSYPTAIKWLLEEKLAYQPTGKQGQILVNLDKLNEKIHGCKKGKKEGERNCEDCDHSSSCETKRKGGK